MRWTVVLAILLLTGCSTPVDGGAVGVAVDVEVTATTDADPVPWDPCTIPDSAVEAAGLNVGSKESGIFGRDQPNFKICSWEDHPDGHWFSLTIYASFNTLDWIYDPQAFDRIEPVAMTDRVAVQYQTVGADSELDCGLAFQIQGGLVQATLFTDALVDGPVVSPCVQLKNVLAALDANFPA